MSDTTRALEELLAQSYALYLKTQNFHWNVTGPHFAALHALFEEQYTEYAVAIDEIAERIRALGERAPGSFSEFAKMSDIQESTSSGAAMAMVKELASDQQKVVRSANKVLKAGQQAEDEATVDLAIQRIQTHEKNAWMLNSLAE